MEKKEKDRKGKRDIQVSWKLEKKVRGDQTKSEREKRQVRK